ncbi:MAG: hypothetical protein ACJAW0_001992, partial [Zhongshania sp.]
QTAAIAPVGRWDSQKYASFCALALLILAQKFAPFCLPLCRALHAIGTVRYAFQFLQALKSWNQFYKLKLDLV